MTTLMDGHVRLDERGVPYVGKTRLKLIHLVMAYQSVEGSMEGLQDYYSWLPLSDAHAALGYYFDHQAEVDRMIEEYHESSERARAEAGESPLARLARERRGE